MPLSPNFMTYALDLLAGFGGIEAKSMFGGAGLYCDGVMFGILDDDVIYLRVDDALQAELEEHGSAPWSYSVKGDGAVRKMGYWSLPEAAADDPDEAVMLARRAYAAAVKRQALHATKPRSKDNPAKAKPAAKTKKTAATKTRGLAKAKK